MVQIINYGSRKIAIKGIGKMFFQEGYPISMAIESLAKDNVEVSLLHVADECLKNNWSPETTLRKLSDEFADDPRKNAWNKTLLSEFVFADYESQREMIFKYLFTSDDDLEHFKSLIISPKLTLPNTRVKK